jgi:hypothetical protein
MSRGVPCPWRLSESLIARLDEESVARGVGVEELFSLLLAESLPDELARAARRLIEASTVSERTAVGDHPP